MRFLTLAPELTKELCRFVIAGVVTTILHFVVLSFCFTQLRWDIGSSTLIAFLVAVTFSYVANYQYTFKSKQQHTVSAPKFIVTALIGLTWNILLMLTLVDHLAVDYRIAFLPATAVVMANNYLLNKFWVY